MLRYNNSVKKGVRVAQTVFDYGKLLKVYQFELRKDFYDWVKQNGWDKQYDYRLTTVEETVKNSIGKSYYCLCCENKNKLLNICCVVEQQVMDGKLKIDTTMNTGDCIGYIRSVYLDDVRNFIKDYMHYDMYKLSEYDLEELGYVKNVKNYADKNIIDIFDIKEDLDVTTFYIDWLNNKKVDSTKIKGIWQLKGFSGDEGILNTIDRKNATQNHIKIMNIHLEKMDLTNFSCFESKAFPELLKLSFKQSKIGRALNLSFFTKLDVVEFCRADLTEMEDLKVSSSVSTIDLSGAKLGYFRFDLKRLGPKFVFDKIIPIWSV